MKRDIVERIQQFNQERDLELVQYKYQCMRADPFAFFRGTCHLFYQDWSTETALNAAPLVWICGDLHLENFGTYRGDDQNICFDLNDFDEAVLAPCTWDLARFLTSVFVWSQIAELNDQSARHLGKVFLDGYTDALLRHQPHAVTVDNSRGLIKALMEDLQKRSHRKFLDSWSQVVDDKRQLKINFERTLPVVPADRPRLTRLMKVGEFEQAGRDAFCLIDLARRVAGTSSLGLKRYVLLVNGKGSPDRNYLLDLKQARTSCLQPYLKQTQPTWLNEADRIVSVQKHSLATPPVYLMATVLDGTPYVIRELQPVQDRLRQKDLNQEATKREKVFQTMGKTVANNHLRSAEQRGSASATALADFTHASNWQTRLLDDACDYQDRVEEDYHTFYHSTL